MKHGADYLFSLIKSLLVALFVLSLAGCMETVYSQLSERQANDMLLTLRTSGVDAEKRFDGEKGYSVWADETKLAQAIEILKANALPEEGYQTMGDLFSRNQLISTPTEERVRYVYGIEQALASTLSKIDGVLLARVHIVLPANDPLAKEARPSSASVFLKHRANINMQIAVPAVKDMVVRSVEGLTVDRVSVTLFPSGVTSTPSREVPTPRLLGAMLNPTNETMLWVVMALPWFLLLIMGSMLVRRGSLRELVMECLGSRKIVKNDKGFSSTSTFQKR